MGAKLSIEFIIGDKITIFSEPVNRNQSAAADGFQLIMIQNELQLRLTVIVTIQSVLKPKPKPKPKPNQNRMSGPKRRNIQNVFLIVLLSGEWRVCVGEALFNRNMHVCRPENKRFNFIWFLKWQQFPYAAIVVLAGIWAVSLANVTYA